MNIYTLISDIPDVIWSGVIASLLTLSGVMLSNRSNTKRLQLQLKHDSDEKSKQRKADLRKEVYLRAAEELVKANAHIASLPQLDITKVNPADGLQGFFSAAAKLQMISEPNTYLKTSEIVCDYSELLLKGMQKNKPIYDLQIDINISNNSYEREQAEVSRILAAMAQFNESGGGDGAVFEVLSRSFEFHQAQASKFSKERDEFWGRKNALHTACVKDFIVDMKLISERSIELLIEIRKELEVGGNIDEFKIQMQRQQKRIITSLDSLIDTLSQDQDD
jgi:hypothetical protein